MNYTDKIHRNVEILLGFTQNILIKFKSHLIPIKEFYFSYFLNFPYINNCYVFLKSTYQKLLQFKIARYSAKSFIYIFLSFILLDILFPVHSDIHYSQTILSRECEVLGAFLSRDGMWRFKSDLKDVSPQLVTTIIFKEDKLFYFHTGVNPLSICRAIFSNITSKKRVSGASTITMQVVRMLQPKNRTYFNKLIEIFRAVQLEFHYSKNEILEMYLNHLPYGGNIEGCGTASVIYFGVNPDKLSLAQASALSVIPQNPNKFRPGRYNDVILQSRNKILKSMEQSSSFIPFNTGKTVGRFINKYLPFMSIFPREEIKTALSEDLTAYRREIPKFAPQLAYRLNSRFPNQTKIQTKISYRIQSTIAELLQNHLTNHSDKNINNACAIVIDNRTKNVIAYAGSNDFFDKVHSGQVDGIRAVRSPGSTLKPLAYSMGFDMGIITPKSRLLDVPILNSEYSPENFSSTFKGEVTTEDALIHSLNVPAVRLLTQIGCENFINRLIKAGFKTVKKDRRILGLSVILGGCGVTLEELANMYSGISTNGVMKNLRYTNNDDKDTTSTIIMSTESAYLISDILSKSPRPDVLVGYLSVQDIPLIAWKTGTSYGRRDAWSIGYNPEYTVAVWAGNFSGAASADLTGSEVSTPLMFEIFRYINKHNKTWFKKPEKLETRYVDQQTGLLPGEFTSGLVQDYYIPLVSKVETSDNFVNINVSLDEKISYCKDCLPDGNYKMKTYPKIHPDLQSYYEKYSIPYQQIPPHNPKCLRIAQGTPPVISYPYNGQEYILEKNNKQKIILKCNTRNDITDVYWFINDKFFIKAPHGESVFFTPEFPGNYKISCADELGRNCDINIKVSFY